MKDKDGKPRTIKATTVHREITDIQAIFNWAVKRRYIVRNPLDGYEKPERDDEVIMSPTEDEVARILKHSPEHLVRALAVSWYTGLRPGQAELLRLTWDDVDWGSQTIQSVSAKKGGPQSRNVPIHPDFLLKILTVFVLISRLLF